MTGARSAGRWLLLPPLERRVFVGCADEIDGTVGQAFRIGRSDGSGEPLVARRVRYAADVAGSGKKVFRVGRSDGTREHFITRRVKP